jgi:hypothetical protein
VVGVGENLGGTAPRIGAGQQATACVAAWAWKSLAKVLQL